MFLARAVSSGVGPGVAVIVSSRFVLQAYIRPFSSRAVSMEAGESMWRPFPNSCCVSRCCMLAGPWARYDKAIDELLLYLKMSQDPSIKIPRTICRCWRLFSLGFWCFCVVDKDIIQHFRRFVYL